VYDRHCEREIMDVFLKLMPCILHFTALGCAVQPAPTQVTREVVPGVLVDLGKMVRGVVETCGALPSHILRMLGIDIPEDDGKEIKKVSTLSGLFTLVNDVYISLDGKIKRAGERDRKGTGVSKDGQDISTEGSDEVSVEVEETGEMGRGLRIRKRRVSHEDRWDGQMESPQKKSRRVVCYKY
jgi:hypothetical protein